MNSLPVGGVIPIACLPANVLAQLGLSLPESKPQVTAGDPVAQDPQAPRNTWHAFWPYAIDVIRKHEEKEGVAKVKQQTLMKFAGTLKKKPYAEWTDSEILAEYAGWTPPAEEEPKPSLKAVLKVATAQLKEVEKEIESKKKGKAVKKTEEKPIDKPVEKSEEKPKAKKAKQQKEEADPPAPPTPAPNAPSPEPAKAAEVPLPPSPPETETDTLKEPIHQRRKNIPKHIKTLVWNKYIGSGIALAKCISCRQEEIKVQSFHCGHVVAESKGGDMTINNLRPICAHCNLSMGARSMNEFTSEFFGWTV